MIETSAHLIDHVLPAVSIRQWVLAFPWPLRLLLSTRPEAVTRVLAIVARAIETALIRRAGKTRKGGACGGIVTLTYPARFSASGVRLISMCIYTCWCWMASTLTSAASCASSHCLHLHQR